MPLSEHEQRLLDQIERALYAEDPKFASNVRGARMRSLPQRRRIQGIALFALGLLLLVAGVVLPYRALSALGIRAHVDAPVARLALHAGEGDHHGDDEHRDQPDDPADDPLLALPDAGAPGHFLKVPGGQDQHDASLRPAPGAHPSF